MGLFKKKSADHALKDLVDQLTEALGGTLLSVLLYGSKASGEFHEDRSNVNVFVLVDNVLWETLGLLSNPLKNWLKAGHAMPVIVQKSELQIYTTNLPIEFLDMQDHHKVLFGSDPLKGLTVDRSHLRAQCAQELSIKQLKLRQACLLLNGNDKLLREALIRSLPSMLTLFRAALRLEADVPEGHKMAAAKELAARAGFAFEGLERLSELHVRRGSDDVNDLARQYLEDVERVVAYVSKR